MADGAGQEIGPKAFRRVATLVVGVRMHSQLYEWLLATRSGIALGFQVRGYDVDRHDCP
jgi:hypothetical protein